MNVTGCSFDTPYVCREDPRRTGTRASDSLGGIDYVEVYEDGVTLCVHLFGSPPRNLTARNVVIEGGARIRDIVVLSAEVQEHVDGDLCLRLKLDKQGDFSRYCVCLIEPREEQIRCSHDPERTIPRTPPKGIDPRYACATFTFRIDCQGNADCLPEPCPPPPTLPAPRIDYLARDYASFKRLLMDRLATTLPLCKETHAADFSMTIVELMAHQLDQLSYELDAVATEAFLRTARKRISVRRHARLVDYRMHEGLNARAWITIACDSDLEPMHLADLAFASIPQAPGLPDGGVLDWERLRKMPEAVIYEPVSCTQNATITLIAAHSEIYFYTWEGQECCLPAGSTRATFHDEVLPKTDEDAQHHAHAVRDQPKSILHLHVGDVLILEQTRGCATGLTADADPARRHAVRISRTTRAVDPKTFTKVLEVEWHEDDALPFDLHLSVRTADCKVVGHAAVARGNVVLVDHGVTRDDDQKWTAESLDGEDCCICDGPVRRRKAAPFGIVLTRSDITFAEPCKEAPSAAAIMTRDARSAAPAIRLDTAPPSDVWQDTYSWRAVPDLLSGDASDERFVAEIDDDGFARLRFDDDFDRAGWTFRARYRVGCGPAGNVGCDRIVWLSHKKINISGGGIRPRNPSPAMGGVARESIEDVKRNAPYAFGRVLERAVAADDYVQIAKQDARVQGACAELQWTGSWYELVLAVDPYARFREGDVHAGMSARVERVRRIGHDLRIVTAQRVPLTVELCICVMPHHLTGDVERAVKAALGPRGMFHPDKLVFGADVAASRIVSAVQNIAGVEHVVVLKFGRLFDAESSQHASLESGVIPIARDEVAILDNDPNFPEHGQLVLDLRGGR